MSSPKVISPRTRRLFGVLLVTGLYLGAAGLLAAGRASWAEDPKPAQEHAQKKDAAKQGLGAAVCLKCHENDKVMGILQTPHAKIENLETPAAKDLCESCHGPSAAHMEFPMQVGNIVFTKFGKTPIAERNRACLACHQKGAREHWNEGAHGAKLACNSCHVIHQPKDPALAKTGQAERCGLCHEEILKTAPASTSHPLTGEKAIQCTTCHNPHGPVSLISCNDCHKQDAATFARQNEKARSYHERALAQKIECTACHKGFVHAMPQITRADQPPGS